MKNYLLLMILALPLAFASCKKDEIKDTTYSFSYDLPGYEQVSVHITIFEYNQSGEIMAQNPINIPSSGVYSKKFVANERSEKVKVYISMGSGTNAIYRWVQQVYYLKTEGDINIDIIGTTSLGINEP